MMIVVVLKVIKLKLKVINISHVAPIKECLGSLMGYRHLIEKT